MTGAPQAPPERHVSVGEFVGVPLVLGFLLFVVNAHLHDVWGIVWSVVFLAIVAGIGGAAAWELARGRRDGASDGLARAYAVASLLGLGVLPLGGWCLVVLAHRPWGVALPLVPAAALWLLARLTPAAKPPAGG